MREAPWFLEWSGPWCNLLLECVICTHKQVSTFPSCCDRIECLACGYMNLLPALDSLDGWTAALQAQHDRAVREEEER